MVLGTGTSYKPETLRQCDKKVKTKSQKVFGANSYVCRSYRGKTGRGGLFLDMLQHSMQEIPELQFVFVKVPGLQACSFIKKKLQHKFFSVNIAKLLETAFL